MPAILPKLLPVFALIILGALLGRRGFISEAFAEGAKRLVASVSLPALLFMAVSRLSLQASHLYLALVVFASCGLLALMSLPLAALTCLPQPATRMLFQGFEAGGGINAAELNRRLVTSPVIIAIAAGLASAAFVPGAEGLPWAPGAALDPSLTAIALVIGGAL